MDVSQAPLHSGIHKSISHILSFPPAPYQGLFLTVVKDTTIFLVSEAGNLGPPATCISEQNACCQFHLLGIPSSLSSPITAAVIHTLAIPLLGSHALPLLSQSLGCGVLNSVRHVTLHELYCKGNLFCFPLLYTLGWLLAGVPNIWDLIPDDLRWS